MQTVQLPLRVLRTNPSYSIAAPAFPHLSTLLFTVEHATNRLPLGYSWGGSQHLKDQHWGIDIGAEEVAFFLAQRMASPILTANVSRLLIDYNRPLSSDTLIRTHCDGIPVEFNQNLTEEEVKKRISEFHQPYREAFLQLLAAPQISHVLSIHSFTDCYEGQKREVEIGILCRHEHRESVQLSEKMKEILSAKGYITRINEPWTGSIMDVVKDANDRGKIGIGFEFRQDLLQNKNWMNLLCQDITATFKTLSLE